MQKAITIILVILCSLLLWIDIVYKGWLEEARDDLKPCEMEAVRLHQEWERCENNFQIITDYHCSQKNGIIDL